MQIIIKYNTKEIEVIDICYFKVTSNTLLLAVPKSNKFYKELDNGARWNVSIGVDNISTLEILSYGTTIPLDIPGRN